MSRMRVSRSISGYLLQVFILFTVVLTLNGCAVTAATVIGVTAYEMSDHAPKPEEIVKLLNQQIESAYLSVAVLNKTIVLAGQVSESSDIIQAKNMINTSYTDYTVYSYLKLAPVESKAQQKQDSAINTEAIKLIHNDIGSSGTSTVANSDVYLLTDNKPTPQNINLLSDKILKIPGVNSVITIQKRPEF